jgi:hypothetical protein
MRYVADDLFEEEDAAYECELADEAVDETAEESADEE